MLTIRFELTYFFVSQILVTKGENRKDALENFPKSKALGFLKATITTVCVLLKDFLEIQANQDQCKTNQDPIH